MKLLHRDIIAVHEEVQQVDGQVSGCRTQPEAVADDGYEVCEVPPQVELRRLAFEGRQLELLLDDAWDFMFTTLKIGYNAMYICKRIQKTQLEGSSNFGTRSA